MKMAHAQRLPQRGVIHTQCSATATPSQDQIPKTTKKLVARQTGNNFREVAQVVEVALPALAPDDILVKVQYAGVNAGCETFRSRGEYWFNEGVGKNNFRLGAEGCGTVLAVGRDVSSINVGDAVSGSFGFTCYAVAPASKCYVVPEVSPQVTALLVSGLLAYAMIWETLGVQSGQHVLVTAAAGALGSLTSQVALQRGCHVTVTCGTAAKQARLEQGFQLQDGTILAPNKIYNYRSVPLTESLKTDNPKFDYVIDGVAGPLIETLFPYLAPGGTYLVPGYISCYPHTSEADQEAGKKLLFDGKLPSCETMFWGRESREMDGKVVRMNPWPSEQKGFVGRCLKGVFELQQNGGLDVWFEEFVGLELVPDAVERQLSGEAIGKVVVALQ